jgi:hypothetical protein
MLKDEDIYFRSEAAQVLGQWGGVHDVVQSLLTHFRVEECDQAMTFLLSGSEAEGKLYSSEAAAALATILKPRADDTPGDEAHREVVFHWLWHRSQSS